MPTPTVTKRSTRTRPSMLDKPPVTKTLLELSLNKAKYPNSHRFPLKSVADEVFRRHGIKASVRTIARQLKKLGAYTPWLHQPKRG